MVEELDFHGYICALCENRINLDSECCCQNSEDALFEVTDERLLKRSNLRRGDKVCVTHLEKLKNGLIFGGSANCCSAPFHVGSVAGQRLRPVPRSWRQYFDASEVAPRYMPALQICNTCYKITLDLMLEENTETGDDNSADSTVSSQRSSYMSPRRWMSTQSLQNTETTSEGSGFYLLSSQQRLRQHGKLLSLYAVHREKYGHPRVIPDSVLRYFNSGVRQNTSGNNDSFLGETSSGEHQLDNGSEEASLAKTDTFPDESEFSHSWSKPYSNRKTVQLCNSSKENKDSPTSERLCYRIYSDKSANLSKTEIEIDGKSPGFTGPGNRTARVLRDSIEYQNKNEEIVQEIVKSGCSLSRHASDENINNIQVTEVSRTKIARNALHPNELNATCPPETRKSLTITFHSVKNSAFLEGDENKLADKETTEKFSQTELPECGEETSLHCVPGMLNREAILQISHTNETEAISSNIQFSGETFDDLTESDRSWNHKMSNVTASCLRMSSSIAKQVVIFVLDSFSSNRRTGSKTDVALHSAGTLRKLSFEVFANSLAQNMVRLAIDDSIKLKQERVERQVVSNHKINDPSLEHFSYFGSTLADVIMTDVKTTTRQLKACRRCTSAILQGCLQIITFAKQEAEQIMTTAAGILQTTSEEHLIDKLANSVVEKAISSALFNMKDDFDSDTSFKCQKQTATESSWLEDKQCYRTVLFAKVKDHTDMPLETHISESEVAKGDNLLAESETSSHQSTFNNTAQRISQSEISFTNSPIPFHCHEESSTANLVDCFVDDLVPQERSLSLDCLLQPTALILEQCVNFGLRRSASADSFFVSAFKASSEIVNNRLLEKLCDSTSVEPFSKTSSSIPSAVTTKAIEEEKGPGEQPLQQNHSDTSSEIEFSPESSSIPDQKNVIGAEAESSCVNSDVNAAILSFLPALEERSETTKLQSTPANNQIVGDDGCEQDEEKIFSLPVFFHHSVEECVMKNDRAEKESEPAHTQATESASAELSTCELLEEAGAENSLPGEGNIQATACDTHLTANISEKSMAETASNQTVLQKMSTVSGEVLQRRKKFPVVDEEVYEKYAETTARTRTSQFLRAVTEAGIFGHRLKALSTARLKNEQEFTPQEEEEDVADVICSAIESITPRAFHRKTSPLNRENDETRSTRKFIIKALALASICSVLLYASWKFYHSK